jgi:hypothetical protein
VRYPVDGGRRYPERQLHGRRETTIMPITFNEREFDSDDPGRMLRDLATPDASAAAPRPADTPWVEPDYSSITPDEQLDGPGPHRAWPGPPLVMPAGLLPDGQPYSGDDVVNATRINGTPPRNAVEADGVVRAYEAQQRLLRREAGIPRSFRDASGRRDQPAALKAIIELHQRERARRAGRLAS